jgi:antitoxin (DNA-binding transcriptional repressor) of toxin-antitoxin stability system
MTKPVQIPLTRIRRQGAEIFARVCYRREEVIVTDYGKPIARIIPMGDAIARLPRQGKRINSAHIGSDFNDFLREEGIYDEVSQAARERVARWLLTQRKRRPIDFYKACARKVGVKTLVRPAEIPAVTKITKRNRHPEVKTGRPVGREAW